MAAAAKKKDPVVEIEKLERRLFLREQSKANAKEHLDTTPVELSGPRPLSLQEEMRRFITTEISRQAETHGAESFEEADDFEIEDDMDDLTSEYTVIEMAPEAGGLPNDLEGELADPQPEKDAQRTSEDVTGAKVDLNPGEPTDAELEAAIRIIQSAMSKSRPAEPG